MHRSVSASLLLLIAVFIIGLGSVTGINRVFMSISEKLDKRLENAEARNKIGEGILSHLNEIESIFYRVALSRNSALSDVLRKDIREQIAHVRNSLRVLEYGGDIDHRITLNIANREEYTSSFSYYPEKTNTFTIEAIDLLPKLRELEIKVDELIRLIEEYDKTGITPAETKLIERRTQIFIKLIPTTFIRMKENASRLMYHSYLEVREHKQAIMHEKQKYAVYEFIISLVVLFLIFLLWLKISRQIKGVNLTLVKTSEQLHKLAVEAEEANNAKSLFLANMSHEIRTPLNSIIGFSEILSLSPLPVQEKEYATVITRSAKALLSIINDILDISKIESGNIELSADPFEPAAVFDQTVELFSVKAHEKHIRFNYEYDISIPKSLKGDYFRIQQVTANLISNAIKFTPEKGRIDFSVMLVSKTQNSCRILVSVKDSGIGIPEDSREKIFSPFTQADGSITRRFGGTGLGLTICRKLINLMGSDIKLESEPGKGSTFSFELTATIADDFVPEQRHVRKKLSFAVFWAAESDFSAKRITHYLKDFGDVEENPPFKGSARYDLIFCICDKNSGLIEKTAIEYGKCPIVFIGNKNSLTEKQKASVSYLLDVPIYGSKIFNIISSACGLYDMAINESVQELTFGGKILVAEDNPSNQMLIKIMLKKLGFEIDIAQDGREAVQKYMQENYRLVFMDINMPVQDGIAAAKEIIGIKENLMLPHTPIIALTANAVKGDREKYIEAGMDDYLSKPIDHKELKAVIEKYCAPSKQTASLPEKPGTAEHPAFNKLSAAEHIDLDLMTYEMLADNFFLSLGEKMRRLKEAVSTGDAVKTAETAHYIKGACASLGMSEPAEILDLIETNALKGFTDGSDIEKCSLIFEKIKKDIFG